MIFKIRTYDIIMKIIIGLFIGLCISISTNADSKKIEERLVSPGNLSLEFSLIEKLVEIRAKGGNYLLNIGPGKNGPVPSLAVERLNDIADWMDVNSQSIQYYAGKKDEDTLWLFHSNGKEHLCTFIRTAVRRNFTIIHRCKYCR
jgi:hypothetical protein